MSIKEYLDTTFNPWLTDLKVLSKNADKWVFVDATPDGRIYYRRPGGSTLYLLSVKWIKSRNAFKVAS